MNEVPAQARRGTTRRSWGRILMAITCLCLAGLGLAPYTAADEEEPPAPPPGDIQELPSIHVRAPRVHAGPDGVGSERTVTSLRHESETFDAPHAVTVLDGDDITRRRIARSLPDALLRLPGVMVQKTAPLQASPYIRGFTGYHNLALIDGIRLNNSAFRAGPVQYWSTLDPYTTARLEVVRGPHSVLFGSDAVGGTVNAVPWRRERFEPGLHVDGRVFFRAAGAENALAMRTQVEGNRNHFGWAGGITVQHFGDIESGADTLPGTGGIDALGADLRFDWRLSRRWEATLAWQHARHTDAPRTEKTVDSVSFHGTKVGSELRRDYDQARDLAYVRLAYDAGAPCFIERATITFSAHRHEEERDRLRTSGRRDLSGFTLWQWGFQAQAESPTRIGRLTYGVEAYHDTVDSFRDDYVGGLHVLSHVQGPLGDDARYTLLGAYVQDEIAVTRRLDLIAGVRFSYAAAAADRVDDPLVAGNDPSTPGNVIELEDDWTSVVGSLRAIWRASPCLNVYGGVSQAFRAPSLYDITSYDSTSVVETPSPGLDPEHYLSFELGAKTERARVTAGVSGWLTLLDDVIVRSPTGTLIDDTPEVRKDNIGDGWMWGVEVEAAWRLHRAWTAYGNASYMDGEADEFDASVGGIVESTPSRMKPLTALLGVRYQPPTSRLWAEAQVATSDAENRLSLRDQADTRRIPPGGTPAWTTVNVRAGYRLGRWGNLTLALENLLDEDYRIHGSGQNEPGFNVVVGLDITF